MLKELVVSDRMHEVDVFLQVRSRINALNEEFESLGKQMHYAACALSNEPPLLAERAWVSGDKVVVFKRPIGREIDMRDFAVYDLFSY